MPEQQTEQKPITKLRELEKWQKKKLFLTVGRLALVFTTYITVTAVSLFKDRSAEEGYWTSSLQTPGDVMERVDALSAGATDVLVGTYVENLKDVSLKNSSYQVVFQAWFRWEGDPELDMAGNFRVYKGTVSGKEIIRDYHEGNVNYQLVRATATVSKNFWTRRFPLESHQLRFYLESDYPVEKVRFVPDKENSGINASLSVNGFNLVRHEVNDYYARYDNGHSDPEFTEVITPELVTAIEINRTSFGLYAKCFIALIGTIGWIMITLYINTYHHVDPLGMIPAALFGTVSNIMVGANLLPDALEMGLLEYVNIMGIMIILSGALSIINVNRIRNKYSDRGFAQLFGRTMFGTILLFTLAGNLILPLVSYLF